MYDYNNLQETMTVMAPRRVCEMTSAQTTVFRQLVVQAIGISFSDAAATAVCEIDLQ